MNQTLDFIDDHIQSAKDMHQRSFDLPGKRVESILSCLQEMIAVLCLMRVLLDEPPATTTDGEVIHFCPRCGSALYMTNRKGRG